MNTVTSTTSTIELPQLNFGDSGGAVRFLQQVLVLRYCHKSVTVNGQFDETTQAAVKEFQGWNGLVPNGIVGELTWQALGRYISA
ncbi:peptidoglycan-binding protein [Oscillatoriales cyanobacterium LEGE 11467]|uniref:Peptidoglycan-binding protein n=1 Tax=Zarconia navalis LEGE 11467 TaxID=1828826 RepID=A0A928Z720_9CYAN|nr:peptidoglycan-binding domain-containing protein [Zarconia navalis]MBE9040105.1 peptidoglycan-binding protein [Zarconia navalis LEGE 11467]